MFGDRSDGQGGREQGGGWGAHLAGLHTPLPTLILPKAYDQSTTGLGSGSEGDKMEKGKSL